MIRALVVLVLLVLIVPALAHDLAGIGRPAPSPFNGTKSPAGEWCCGEGDCFVIRGVHTVSLPGPGYRLPGGEFVPQTEAQPSPDGQFWRCKRPDGTRRCFFAPHLAM